MASAPTGSVHHPKAALRLSASSCSLHPSGTLVRLQEMGFVEYERYHGASLTEEGLSEALRLVRRHRLIETFLLEQLGHPAHDPHGDPIPAVDGPFEPDGSFPPAAAAVGQRVLIARVGYETTPMLTYLGERGLVPGRVLTVKEVRTLDGVITIADEDGTTHSLGAPLADALFVRGASRYDAE